MAGPPHNPKGGPLKRKFYRISARIKDETVARLARHAFAYEMSLDEFLPLLLDYLYRFQEEDALTKQLFKAWKEGKPREEWPVVLQREFTRLYGDKSHRPETLKMLLARKHDMTKEDLVLVEKRQK